MVHIISSLLFRRGCYTMDFIQIRMIYFHSHIHTEKALNGM